MFNLNKFSEILRKINDSYDTMSDFGKNASFDRSYISKYINKKLNNPPSPKILEKIAKASHGITTYDELMQVCGYTNTTEENYVNAIIEFSDDKSKKVMAEALEKLLSNKLSLDDLSNFIESKSTKYKESIYRVVLYLYNKLSTNYNDKYNLHLEFKPKPYKVLQNEYIESLIYSKKSNGEDKKTNLFLCPVYGQIPAGEPNWSEQCLEGYLPLDPNLMNIHNPEECFFLLVKGESMNKVIRNGAYALIRKCDIVENGEIAAVLVNGYDATLKKFSRQGNLVILEPMSNDPSFNTQVYDKNTRIKIIGKYIGKFEINN